MKSRSIVITALLSCLTIVVVFFSCTKAVTDSANSATATAAATITALNCAGVTFSSGFTSGTAYSGTATIPYTGGNGETYTDGTGIASTGVTGLTATLQGGTLAATGGNLIYVIKGTPTTSGTASFAITFGGQNCTIALPMASSLDCSTATTTVAKLVCMIQSFKATLTSTQLAAAQLDLTQTNSVKWSNLPCGSSCRNGVQFSTLSADQITAALAILATATGTTTDEGYSEALQIRAADDVLAAASGTGTGGPGGPGGGGGGGYSSGTYFLAFLGTPSITGTWQLQFGGHHLAVNVMVRNGVVAGATPYFEGVEPKTWTTNGTTYAPLASEQSTMAAMLASLSATQLATAKLSATFSDVLLGPSGDGKFPVTKLGLAVSTLSEAQKLLVLEAMKPWVKDADDATAASLLAIYQNELNGTYISFSGNATLSNNADYVRIDGPSVWIEFVCQSGVVFQNQIHYHSVWRDHTRDYGGNYTF
jgi:hypothetical protein